MNPLEAAVVITAMTFGYKLASQIISRAKEPSAPKPPKHRRFGRKSYEIPPVTAQEPITESSEELLMRAQEMQKRIITLEEIIASERVQRSQV